MGASLAVDVMSVLGVKRRGRDLLVTNAPSAGRGLLQGINDSLVGVVHWRQTILADHQMSLLDSQTQLQYLSLSQQQKLVFLLLQVNLVMSPWFLLICLLRRGLSWKSRHPAQLHNLARVSKLM